MGDTTTKLPEMESEEMIDFSDESSLLPSIVTPDTEPPKPKEEELPPPPEEEKTEDEEDKSTDEEEEESTSDDSEKAEEPSETKEEDSSDADDELEDFPSLDDEDEEEEEEVVAEEPKTTGKRDYSAFEEEDVEWLKKAPNHVFARAKERLTELYEKANNAGNSASVYENPNAFLLSPEYHQAAQQSQEFSAVAQHWQMQLVNIESGNKWTTLGRDQQGQLTVTGEQEPSPQAKAAVLAALTESQQMATQSQAKVQGIQQSYHQQFTQSKKALNEVMDKYIKQLPSVIQPSTKDVGVLKQHIPSEFKEHPMADLASKIYGVAKRQQQYIKQLQKRSKRGAQLAKAKEAAPEITGRVKKSTPRQSNDEIDFDAIDKEFKSYKEAFGTTNFVK